MSQHFSAAYSFLAESLAKGNVLVHCAAGVSRVINDVNEVSNNSDHVLDEESRMGTGQGD